MGTGRQLERDGPTGPPGSRSSPFTGDGGAAGLTGASSTTDVTFTTLGLRASTDLPLGGMKATARGMWAGVMLLAT